MNRRWIRAGTVGPLAAAVLAILFLATPAPGHGVNHVILDKDEPVVAFRVGFSSGEPASYAQVLVHGPDAGAVEHQNGRTDRLGRFAFLPDRQGVWRVEVDAGMGHRVDFTVAVDASGLLLMDNEESGSTHSPEETWVRAGLGVSLLFNLACFAAWLRRGRS